jgi:hypothetical protein
MSAGVTGIPTRTKASWDNRPRTYLTVRWKIAPATLPLTRRSCTEDRSPFATAVANKFRRTLQTARASRGTDNEVAGVGDGDMIG